MSTESEAAIADRLFASEQALLDPAIRRDRTRVAHFLAADFVEFGSSGRVFTRDQILDLLATQQYTPPALEDFACRLIAPHVALVTYRTVRTDAQTGARHVTLRSSIWIRGGELDKSDHWRITFHQGTNVP